MQITDTLGFLVGTWQVTRTIVDRRAGCSGRFEGRATILGPSPTTGSPIRGARYEEIGELWFATHRGAARRSLDYRRSPHGIVDIRFSDGRHFVDLDLRTGDWHADHACGDDRYEIVTSVRSDDVLEERWRVRGPTKDYDAVTTLLRARHPSDTVASAEVPRRRAAQGHGTSP